MFIITKQGFGINLNNIKFYEANHKGGTRIWFTTNGKKCVTDTPTEFKALIDVEVERWLPPGPPSA